MNTKMLSTLLPVAFVILSSCSDVERDGGFNRISVQKHAVKYRIYSDDPSSVLHISHDGGFDTKGGWEQDFVTDGYFAKIDVFSQEGSNALITGEIYVDGELKVVRSRNKYLNVCVPLKDYKCEN